MKKTTCLSRTLCLVTSLLFFSTTNAQNFSDFENFFTLSKKQVQSKLIDYGYTFKSKDIKSGIITYEKSPSKGVKYYLNISFKADKLSYFLWDEKLEMGNLIIEDINKKDYIELENKSNETLGIFYLESLYKKIEVIIFKTQANIQNGKISFKLSKKIDGSIKEKPSVKQPINNSKKLSLKTINDFSEVWYENHKYGKDIIKMISFNAWRSLGKSSIIDMEIAIEQLNTESNFREALYNQIIKMNGCNNEMLFAQLNSIGMSAITAKELSSYMIDKNCK